jgi:hypothetical protein
MDGRRRRALHPQTSFLMRIVPRMTEQRKPEQELLDEMAAWIACGYLTGRETLADFEDMDTVTDLILLEAEDALGQPRPEVQAEILGLKSRFYTGVFCPPPRKGIFQPLICVRTGLQTNADLPLLLILFDDMRASEIEVDGRGGQPVMPEDLLNRCQ